MNRYVVPKALGPSSSTLADGRRISAVVPSTFAGGLHEALIGAETVGYVELTFEDGSTCPALLVRRQRPFVPCGTDPKHVNEECSRMFAVIQRDRTNPWVDGELFDVVEVTR